MNEKDWIRVYSFMQVYIIVLSILTTIVAAFWIREQITDFLSQSLGAVFLIMLVALLITGWLSVE